MKKKLHPKDMTLEYIRTLAPEDRSLAIREYDEWRNNKRIEEKKEQKRNASISWYYKNIKMTKYKKKKE